MYKFRTLSLSLLFAAAVFSGCDDKDSPNNNDDNKIAVTGVLLNSSTATVEVGKTVTLVAAVQPDNADDKGVTWSSSDLSIAQVANGVVTGIVSGSAIISVTTNDGGKMAVCLVTVSTSGDVDGGDTTPSDVYVAGYERDAQGNNVAKYWINSMATNLESSNSYFESVANSIFVSGNDVYVAGTKRWFSSEYRDAVYWKNGVMTELARGYLNANANSVFVSDNDVHVVGMLVPYQQFTATYWKNGEQTYIAGGLTTANSVFVSGSDVHVAGYGYNGNVQSKIIAKYWKNSAMRNLTNGSNHASANSVFVLGSDVYVAGYEENVQGVRVAKYWKNDVETSLTNGNSNASASSVFVSGSDVYVAGYENNVQGRGVAKYWKNGVETNLTNGNSTAAASSMFILGNDVYVAGYEANAQGIIVAKYWKNGEVHDLSNGNSHAYANSIFVVEKE